MVESSIVSVNVAVIALLIATPVSLLAGLVKLAPAVTVNIPEFVVVKLPDVALISAVPEKCPVKTALLLSPPGTRSPETTPSVMLSSDHASAATLATKLSEASRVIAYTVIKLPEAILCEDTTVPLPSAAVSTRTLVAVPSNMVNELLTADVNPALDAVRFFEPARLMLKSLNVARPLAFVVFGVVPLSTPVPEDKDIATETSGVDTLLPLTSCNCTVTAGLIVPPAVVSDGCWTKTTFVAASSA